MTLSVGNNGNNNVSSANISGGGGITKVGGGLQVFSGTNTLQRRDDHLGGHATVPRHHGREQPARRQRHDPNGGEHRLVYPS